MLCQKLAAQGYHSFCSIPFFLQYSNLSALLLSFLLIPQVERACAVDKRRSLPFFFRQQHPCKATKNTYFFIPSFGFSLFSCTLPLTQREPFVVPNGYLQMY